MESLRSSSPGLSARVIEPDLLYDRGFKSHKTTAINQKGVPKKLRDPFLVYMAERVGLGRYRSPSLGLPPSRSNPVVQFRGFEPHPRIKQQGPQKTGPLFVQYGGEGGIRPHGPREGTLDFESSPFDHSGTSPRRFVWPGAKLGRYAIKSDSTENCCVT